MAAVLAALLDGHGDDKPTGLAKRTQWERAWDLQREEDRTGKRLDIPVPPKYQGTDFQKQFYWRHRGKLDVPKEHFISYPGASPDSDKDSLLIGWAGWDHKDQAHGARPPMPCPRRLRRAARTRVRQVCVGSRRHFSSSTSMLPVSDIRGPREHVACEQQGDALIWRGRVHVSAQAITSAIACRSTNKSSPKDL